MRRNVLITGGTGLVGKAIGDLLTSKGFTVAVLSRQKHILGVKSFYWDYENRILDEKAIVFADIIIHLAGENISSKRWSEKQKKKIVDSRVKTTELLYSAVQKSEYKPSLIISASAIGYYGSTTSDAIYKEEDDPGTDFLAQTVVAWENAVDKFADLGLRVTKLRLGVVMSLEGGALPKMLAPLKFGFALPLGSGNQYVAWIALEDLARLFLFVIEKENAAKVYNAVHPQQITNKQVMQYLARKKQRIYIPLAIPSFVFKLRFGKMAVILLEGSRVSAKKLEAEGFRFLRNAIME